MCHILRVLVKTPDFNYVIHTVEDPEDLYVDLKSTNYTTSQMAPSSSWCLLEKHVCTPSGTNPVLFLKLSEGAVNDGYLLGRTIMFKFNTGWTSAVVNKFQKSNLQFPYTMVCHDDGKTVAVKFDLEKYRFYEECEISSWCLLSFNPSSSK